MCNVRTCELSFNHFRGPLRNLPWRRHTIWQGNRNAFQHRKDVFWWPAITPLRKASFPSSSSSEGRFSLALLSLGSCIIVRSLSRPNFVVGLAPHQIQVCKIVKRRKCANCKMSLTHWTASHRHWHCTQQCCNNEDFWHLVIPSHFFEANDCTDTESWHIHILPISVS